MKLTLKHWLLVVLSMVFIAAAVWAAIPVNAAYAQDGNITCVSASGKYLNDDYLAVHRIPTSMMSYESAGGGSIANAFDGNWNSYWQTTKENNGQNSDNPTFLNAITVTFSKAVEIQSIAYASSSSRLGHGYPITLNIYTANGGDLSLYGTCNSAATDDRVIFTLNEVVTVTQIKFEFRKVNTMHNWTATAKEIQFLQPDNADANKVIDLFGDYAQLTVKDEYKSSLSQIRSGVSNLISYESALKPLLDRADAIVNGQLKKDSRREFSTDKNAENVVTQYGDLRAYAGNTLKMSSFGINRQVLGVGGLKGDTITIYVEADEGDPMPTIAFTQVKGDWRSWQSTYRLARGKNVLTFPNFITDNYTWSTVAGGPIHIINPYEPSQQSSNVKVYVEGGFLYPVFRKGGDVDAFLEELTTYYNAMNETEGMCDVAELVGDHFLHTVSAKRAYNDFITRSVNPQKNAESWDNYIGKLLEFDGIALSPDGEHFNEKNLHLYTNFRVVQPWGGAGAFAAGDHIGFITFGEDGMTRFGVPGWGVAHEIGHALDVNGRTIGETTNNMWAKFELAEMSHTVSRNFNASMTAAMTPDETALSNPYFGIGENYYSYQIWWNLEACYKGFWGKLDNMYRYFNEAEARTEAGVTSEDGQLTGAERMVYFSSLVVGEDLGYYYERYGFSFSFGDNYNPFKEETATAAYKKLMSKALEDNKITKKGFKYWYIDANHYFYNPDNGGCYHSSNSVEIREVWKTASGYMLLLPEPADSALHLGYEIMEYRNGNWYVIGFTYSGSYVDTTEYAAGYVPQYKIRAYDRAQNVSAISAAATYKSVNQTGVCKIGDTFYNSISEAVEAANGGDTIYICADTREGTSITIGKNLTILPDPSLEGSVTVLRGMTGAMFIVNGGVTFTLGSNDGASIILDGNLFSQNGALIKVNGGTLRVYNAELRNNRNTDHGGAVFNTGNSAFDNVIFENNYTSINGGALANFSGGVVAFTNCKIINNKANEKGGAITADGRTSLTGTIVTGNVANQIGGAIFMSCSNDSRSISIEGGEISGNTAGKTQSIVYIDRGILLIVGGDSAAQLSGEICVHQGTATVGTAAPDFSNVIFRTTTVAIGKLVFRTNGDLTLDEDYVKDIKVDSADAYLGEDGKSVYTKPWPTVILNVNGVNVSQYASPNGTALPDTVEGLEESKYILGWEFNGTTYSSGDVVKIGNGDSLKAIIGDKFKVTVHLNDENTRVYYVKPNDSLVIGSGFAPNGKVFSHWECNGSTYKEGDAVLITADTVITAIFNIGGEEDVDSEKGNSTNKAAMDKTVVIAIVVVVLLVVVGVAVTVLVVVMRKKAKKNSKKKSAEKSSNEAKVTAIPAKDVKPTAANSVPTAQIVKPASTATAKPAQSAKTASGTAKPVQSVKATTTSAAKSAQSAKVASTAKTAQSAKPVAKAEAKTGTKSAEKKPTAKKQ